jgi:hypothetical protein
MALQSGVPLFLHVGLSVMSDHQVNFSLFQSYKKWASPPPPLARVFNTCSLDYTWDTNTQEVAYEYGAICESVGL